MLLGDPAKARNKARLDLSSHVRSTDQRNGQVSAVLTRHPGDQRPPCLTLDLLQNERFFASLQTKHFVCQVVAPSLFGTAWASASSAGLRQQDTALRIDETRLYQELHAVVR